MIDIQRKIYYENINNILGYNSIVDLKFKEDFIIMEI